MTTDPLTAALDYARRGWAVFPLRPGEKTPLTTNGVKNATTDPDQIRAWWSVTPTANIGIATGEASGLLVLDLDDSDAVSQAVGRGLPPAPCVETDKGLHVYFRAVPDARNRVRFAPGMDVRASGGYVVAPPSVHPSGAVYRWEVAPAHVADLPDAPSWLADAVTSKNGTTPRPIMAPVEDVDAGASALLREAVLNITRAQNGTRNDTLNRAAYTVGGLVGAGRLDPSTAVAQLRGAALHVGLPERETDRTINSGLLAGAQHPIEDRPRPAPNGNGHASPDVIRGVSPAPLSSGPAEGSSVVLPPDPGQRPSRFTLVRAVDFRDRPAPDCLVEGLLQVDSLAAVVGPWGSYKSFILLDMALSIATGQPWAGRATRQGSVVYISAEGNAALGLRLKAWEIARRTPLDTAPLFVLPDAVNFMAPDHVDDLLTAIRETVGDQVALVVVDTLARAMTGGDENSARDMGLLVEGAERIRRQTGAVVAFAHHPAKNGNGGGRGSGALPGAITTEIRVEKAENVVTVTCGKQKDMAEFESFALMPRVVELDNEGNTSVVLDLVAGAVLTPTQEKLLNALARFGADGATNAEWQNAAKTHGVGRAAYFAQRPTLVDRGFVTVDGSGHSTRFTAKKSTDSSEKSTDFWRSEKVQESTPL